MSHAKRPKKTSESSAPTASSRGGRRPAPVQREQAPGDAGLMDTAAPPMRLSDASTGDGAPGGAVQPKVTVGAPGDRYEREADAVAQRVTQGQPAPPISSLASGGLRAAQRQKEDEEPVQRQAEDEAEVQRQTDATDEDVQRRGDDGTGDEDDLPVQPQSSGDAPGAAGAAPEDDDPVQPASDSSGGSDGSGGRSSSVHARAATAIRKRGAGQPLPRSFRRSVEPLFGRDFSRVRVHTGTDAQEAAQSIHAHAFTHRNHIWLGARASTTDASLMTHELTHVVQQGHAPPLRSSGGTASTSGVQRVSDETEEPVQAAAEPMRDDETVQRFDLWGAVKDVGSSIVSGVQAVGQGIANVAGDLMDMGRSALMAVVHRVAPDFARLIERDGLIGLVKDVVKDGFDALFGGVFDEVTSMFDFEALSEGFSGAVEAVRETAGQLAEGSASAILDAARNVTTFIGDTLSPVIDTVRSVASTIGDVFDSIVNFVGTPVLDFIERVGGSVWRAFKGIVDDVGAIFSTVQDALGAAWSRVKGWFGITADEGTDEGGGIWEWVKEKASNVWDSVTGALEPITGPLGEVGRVLVMLSPAGPALALYENWPKLKQAFAWISEQWNDLNIVVRARDYLREKLLPDMKAFLLSVGDGVQQAANWLSENVGGVAEKVDGVIGALGGSGILAPLRGVFSFVRRQFRRAASFVQTAIRSAGSAVRTLFQRLVAWIDPLLGVLRDLVAAAVNPFGIVGLLLGNFWLSLPQALKGVMIDFILDLLRGFIRAIPPLPQLGLLWPFIRSGMLGFLDRMAEFATERKVAVSNKLATIISGGSFSFAMGYLRGLATGIWEAVTAPFYAIAMLFDLPSMIRTFVTMLGDLFTGIAEEVREIITLVSERFDETLDSVLSAARELLENPGMLIDLISGAIQAALDAVGGLGATFAERLMAIFEQPDEKLGEMLGTLTGNILVEVLIAAFTAGAGNAITGVGRVANLLRRIQRNFQRVLRLVADLMRPVLNFIDRIIDLFRGAMSRVGSIFQRIGEGFGRIVDKFRNLFQRLRGRRPRRTPDGPDAPSRPRRTDATPDDAPDTTPGTTPDVTPTPRARPDTTPDARPRTDTTPDPDRTPDGGRRRRRDDDDDESYAEKQARLRRIVLILRPQLLAYVHGGVNETRLRAWLRRKEIRHRLTDLDLGRGERPSVIARLNPIRPVDDLFDPDSVEINRAIRRVATDVLNDPEVVEAASSMSNLRAQRGRDFPVGIGARSGLPAAARFLRGRTGRQGRTWGGDVGPAPFVREQYRFGPVPVREMGFFGRSNAIVRQLESRRTRSRGPNRYRDVEVSGSGSYEALADRMRAIRRDVGASDRELASAMRTLVTRGRVPRPFRRHERTFAELAFLLFTREGVRNRSALVTSPMLLELVERGFSTFDEALLDLHPMQPRGSVAASRGLSQRIGFEEPDPARSEGTGSRREELRARERRVVVQWLRARNPGATLIFTGREDLEDYIRDQIRQYYGLRG